MSVRTTRSDSIGLPTATRYDLLLALLPVSLLCGAFVSVVTSLPVTIAMGLGSLPSAFLFCYAITVAAPTTATERSA
ncbi:hypothetical protein [Haloplanus aerogenes]|uniref:Uncharacterized protein n=1 Tax=Haloplanus aerogenes TaxID=660522 RepID=A0A3M0DQR7_9EURY|nr:hypothetical protein [Haloplanus aerogenes]AZH24370.1 hypothetical protein DU502_02805 [Haloplanus aerogenes]RMB23992.1 hypothetical protein ATH50_1224 [Haloplanus aerogenes]